ncbi:MAG TPA: hypothetical protein LFW20_04140 [Rickettsia endosymbiont of Omalisus fontisbellaquei]|nr:hypothetical protein [Rickettsia endosymbiont of Omalisus fontisbellaquei]
MDTVVKPRYDNNLFLTKRHTQN